MLLLLLLLLLLALPRRDRNAVMATAAGRIVMAGGLVEVRASEECVRPPEECRCIVGAAASGEEPQPGR